MNVFATLGVILALSALVESLVEAVVGEPLSNVDNPTLAKWKPQILRYVAYAVGIGGAVAVYKFDVVYLLGQYLKADQIPPSVYGQILTGLAIGRGAQFIHDFIQKYIWKRPEQPEG